MKKDIKEIITTEIITMIESAQASGADWTMPFKSLGGKPTNANTGKAYTRLNALWLGLQGYRTVATYRQWEAIGYQVQKGSTGVAISAPMTVKDKQTGDPKMIGFRAAKVFPASMVLHAETGEPWAEPETEAVDLTERLDLADQYVSNLGFDIRHSGEGRAYYQPSGDFIHMPERAAFSATKTSTGNGDMITECSNCSYRSVVPYTISRVSSSKSSSSFGGGSSGGGGASGKW